MDCLYGIKPEFVDKAIITWEMERRPLLMFTPSWNVLPWLPVFLTLSHPAKSTKFNLALVSKPLKIQAGFDSRYFKRESFET